MMCNLTDGRVAADMKKAFRSVLLLLLMPTLPAAASEAKPQVIRVALVQMALRPTLAENRDRIVQGTSSR